MTFVGEAANQVVPPAARISTLYARHEHFLLLLRGDKSGTTLGTKLQKLVSPEGRLPREFILYPGVSGKSSPASRCATLRGSGSLPNVQETVRIFFKMVSSSRVFTHSPPRFPLKTL